MSEKRYSLLEVTENLRISPDTLYRWESQIPELKPTQVNGGRLYTTWEFDLLQQAHRLFHNYNQDFVGTRQALERWVSKNPRPQDPPSAPTQEGQRSSVNPWGSVSAPPPRLSSQRETSADEVQKFDDKQDDRAADHPHSGRSTQVETPKVLDEQMHDESQGSHQTIEDEQPVESENDHEQGRSALEQTELKEQPEAEPAVIQQAGGKRRVIGRTHEDLFSDLDADPYDLSPREEIALRERRFFDPSPSSSKLPQDKESSLTQDSGRRISQSRSIPNRQPMTPSQDRRDPPSASDWLEEPTPKKAVTAQMSQTFEPKRAFSSTVSRPVSVSEPTPPLQTSSSASSPSPSPSHSYGSLTPVPIRSSDQHGEQQGGSEMRRGGWKNKPTSSMGREATPISISGERPINRDDEAGSHPPLALGEQDNWQRAYHHAQAQLARTKGELARAQSSLSEQRQTNKRLQLKLLELREKILKEIYDLRDSVVDK